MARSKKLLLADDDRLNIWTLVGMRFPVLAIGLVLGLGMSFITSRFEEVLMGNFELVFFIPFIVYMAAAVGEQTQLIYIRDLGRGKASFHTYLIKEFVIGLLLGAVFGLIAFLVSMFWIGEINLSLSVGLSMACAVGIAPVVGLVVAQLFKLEKQDPAVDSGPIATIVQDTISILIYGFVTSRILL